ncbi:MAG: hypothetical protein KBS81_00880, partial [Spirochaetales bacterium]|nr:hypothetical protein [Candidatus Physcosoma equi]
MKRILLITMAVLTLLSLFVSCKEEPLAATLRVEMDKGTRTIQPEQDEMEIYGYRVIPVGPDGQEHAARYTYYSYINLDGLTVGNWTIKVYGFSKDRKDLAYGEQKVSLQTGKNTTTIEVKELIGEGGLDLTLFWDSAQLPTASTLKLIMTDQDGKKVELTPSTPVEGKSYVKEEKLPAGSYRLQCELLDTNGKKLSGFAEAIRIANGTVTSGEIQLAVIDNSLEGEVIFSDMTAIPIEVKINGIENLLEARKKFTINLSVLTQNVDTKDLTAKWFLDGEFLGEGTSWTMQNGVETGTHRIDVIASTTERGSVGSASVSFLAAASTSPGSPYQRNTLTHGTTYKMGNNTVAKFLPDNRLVIASNATQLVQLVDISGTSPVLVNEFTYENLSLEGEVADFASYGDEDDAYFSILFLCNTTSSCRIVNVICSKDQMTYNDMVKNPDTTGGLSPANHLVNIVPGDQVFVATIQNADKSRMGYLYLNMNPTHGNMINRKDWFVAEPQMEYGYSG